MNKKLLFLGCGFPGWLGRFFRQVLNGDGPLKKGGIFAHSLQGHDHGYVLFLQRHCSQLWLRDSGVDFVNELHTRWRRAHPKVGRAEVFISYAREDDDVAEKLAGLLENGGASVWLDRQKLRAGEDWNESIKKAIQDCVVFVPVVSRHSLRTETRVCRREWALAGCMPGKRSVRLRATM